MNMALQRHVVVFLLLACLFTPSYSYQFTVGGKDGWVPNPSVSYNTWSQHMRFQINDSVLFKYKQGADSVLEVSKDDYDKCNTGNPIKKMEDGNSVFTLDRSGPFYFISGNKDNCEKGQKLLVVVISVRNQGNPPPTAPPAPKTPAPGAAPPSGSTTPSPTGSPPSLSPPSGGSSPAASPPKGSSPPGTPSAPSANSPAAAPPTGSTSPGTSSPIGAPTSTPAGNTPTASPPAPPTMSPVANGPSTSVPAAPVAGGPSGSMSPAGGPSTVSLAPAAGGPSAGALAPAGGPSAGSLAPAAGGPSAAGSLAPAAGGPAAGLAPAADGPAAGAPGGAAAGTGGSTPADVNSPAGAPENPNSFAVKAFTPSIVLVSAVSLVLTVALGELIILP